MSRELVNRLEKQKIYLQGLVDAKQIDCNNLLSKSKELDIEIKILDEVNLFFTGKIAQKIDSVKHKIENIINNGLSYIFKDEDIRIVVNTTFKHNKTVFSLAIQDNDSESSALSESCGGGLVAIVSFLFKVVINILYKNERFMVFDESLNFVSKQYQIPLSEFLKKLCSDMKTTIVLVTHQPLVAHSANCVYEAYPSKEGHTLFKKGLIDD